MKQTDGLYKINNLKEQTVVASNNSIVTQPMNSDNY